jgi:hypothetical protein
MSDDVEAHEAHEANEANEAHEDQTVPVEEMGGDPPCLLNLFCPDCGVELAVTAHRPNCQDHGQSDWDQ